MTWWAGPDLVEPGLTYDLGVVGEGFRLARLIVRLPLQLDEHGGGLLQVLVPILGGLEDDGELEEEDGSVTEAAPTLEILCALHF